MCRTQRAVFKSQDQVSHDGSLSCALSSRLCSKMGDKALPLPVREDATQNIFIPPGLGQGGRTRGDLSLPMKSWMSSPAPVRVPEPQLQPTRLEDRGSAFTGALCQQTFPLSNCRLSAPSCFRFNLPGPNVRLCVQDPRPKEKKEMKR